MSRYAPWDSPPEDPAPGRCPLCGGELEVDDDTATCLDGCGFDVRHGDGPEPDLERGWL